MDNYTATEQAYKNGYAAGSKETAEKVIEWFLANSLCRPTIDSINKFAKQFGVEIKE